jgi:hypothetical protein
MTKRKAIIGGATLFVLAGIAAWAFGFFNRTDPAIAELQQLGSQMWDRNLPDAQRDQLRNDFRQRMESMSDDQRRAFFDASRGQWEARSQQRMDEFFAMSKADQQKRLDEIINRMIQSRNSQQQNASRGGQNPGGPGANRQGGGRTADNNGGGRGGDGNRGGRGNRTEAQRDERAKRRLDRTSPKMRAQYTEFRKRLDERAQQRGVSMGDQRGGWGFGGFGGGRRG